MINSCKQPLKADEPVPVGFLPENIRLSFTIARKDSIKIERCYGYADKDAEELMNPDNRFRIASISKTFTATAIMKLVEKQIYWNRPHWTRCSRHPRLTRTTPRDGL